ncbi:hypothetical protein, partial [Kitasatospora sp. NPDC057541]|uniref:hypothetical protein n=1 Tax=Kitasatospora sp. NPDC057541 TaxID=3346161 RepID=UPI00368D4F5E
HAPDGAAGRRVPRPARGVRNRLDGGWEAAGRRLCGRCVIGHSAHPGARRARPPARRGVRRPVGSYAPRPHAS